MKKLTGLAALVLAGCTVNVKTPDPLEEARLFSSDVRLMVNPGLPHYALRKNKVIGENELIQLARQADLEEAWIYDEKTSVWLEIGTNESKESCGAEVHPSALTDRLKFYHIHPSGVLKEVRAEYAELKKAIDKLQGVSQELKSKAAQAESMLALAELMLGIPSGKDISNAGLGIDCAIAWERGLTAYKVLKADAAPKYQAFTKRLPDIIAEEHRKASQSWTADPVGEAYKGILDRMIKEFEGEIEFSYRSD